MHWPDPAQRDRLTDIRNNLTARIAEAEREGWLGEVEGLKISRACAEDKLAQIERRTPKQTTIHLGIPTLGAFPTRRLTGRSARITFMYVDRCC
jgi:hypothetical protein